jgi:hypothetical protein
MGQHTLGLSGSWIVTADRTAGVRLGLPRDASTYALYDIHSDIFRPPARLPEAAGVSGVVKREIGTDFDAPVCYRPVDECIKHAYHRCKWL